MWKTRYMNTGGVSGRQFILGTAGAPLGIPFLGGQERPGPGANRWVSFRGQGVYENPLLNVDGEKTRATGYMTDILTHYAVDWLRKPRKSPFCLCLWHKAVHGPFTPALRHSRLFEDVKIRYPKTDDLTGVQGRSMRPVLSGGAGWRNEFFYEYFCEPNFVTPTMRGVRTQRWKYVEYPDVQEIAELYDLRTDPDEMRNLLNEPSARTALEEMRRRLARLVEETK